MYSEINILLLGETGVGKSTFINAFANYMNHQTMEDAKTNPICLIPARFVITDENYCTRNVEFNEDANESYESVGASVTQECRAYCFNYGEVLVRLIDTPGVGDTRGLAQDKTNFENLLSFIAEYKELHLIAILLKPDMPRLTDSFNYCLKQLLCQLHKDAKDNMVFVFTNGRQTFYRPKNTIILLREVLRDIKSGPPFVDIPLDKSTMYCLDNDSFQLLIALHNGIKFSDDEIDDYSNSWVKSVNECKRLMNYITCGKNGKPLPPHPIQNILSVNETRRLILALNNPIVKISNEIDVNMNELVKQKRVLENYTGDIQTYLEGIKSNARNYQFSFWYVLPGFNFVALTYSAYQESRAEKKRQQFEEQLNFVADKKKVKEQLLVQMQQTIEDYIQEKRKIIKSSAKFAKFLQNNAIASYNDVYKSLLLKKIDNVRHSRIKDKEKEIEISNLNKSLDDYENERKILDDNMNKSKTVSDISIESVNNIINKLYKLRVTGKDIKTLHEQSKSKQAFDRKVEVHYTVPHSKTELLFASAKELFASKSK